MKKSYLFIFIPVLVITGCSTPYSYYKAYNGPLLPEDQVAILAVGGPGGVVDIQNVKIDGKQIHSSLPAYIEVLPGRHQVDIKYSMRFERTMPYATYIWTEDFDNSVSFTATPLHDGYYVFCAYQSQTLFRKQELTPYIKKWQPLFKVHVNNVWKKRREIYKEKYKKNPQLRSRK